MKYILIYKFLASYDWSYVILDFECEIKLYKTIEELKERHQDDIVFLGCYETAKEISLKEYND